MNLVFLRKISRVLAVLFGTAKIAAKQTLTSPATGSFDRGAYVEIVAAEGITEAYKPTFIVVSNLSASDEIQIDLASGESGSEEIVTSIMVTGAGRYQLACPELEGDTRLSASVGNNDAASMTVEVNVEYVEMK